MSLSNVHNSVLGPAWTRVNSTMNNSCCQENNCCQENFENNKVLKNVARICKVALGCLALVMAPGLFVTFFTAGLLASSAYSIWTAYAKTGKLPPADNKPVCASGNMEFLAEVRFPAAMTTIAVASFLARHMQHDMAFYGPFVSFFLGFGAGYQAINYLQAKKVMPLLI